MVKSNNVIVIASRNMNKVREFKRIFGDYGFETNWRFLSAIDLNLPQVAETGTTFAENAKIKALSGMKHSDAICIGEDSGLEVDYLGGAPGVNSHRFSQSGTDDDNNKLLLQGLEGVPWRLRTCRYKSAIALADRNGIIAQVSGSVEGLVHTKMVGTNGFGYDPLFYALELNETFGEASDVEKDRISHRRRAIKQIIPYLIRIVEGRIVEGS